MKPGDLVRHRDGEVGILLEINSQDYLYPYRVFFQSHERGWLDWYSADYIVEIVSEGW